MKRTSGNVVRVEQWNVADRSGKDGRVVVSKIATRNPLGQFHGATNFRGTVQSGK